MSEQLANDALPVVREDYNVVADIYIYLYICEFYHTSSNGEGVGEFNQIRNILC